MAGSTAVQNSESSQEQSQNGSIGGPISKVKTQKECNLCFGRCVNSC